MPTLGSGSTTRSIALAKRYTIEHCVKLLERNSEGEAWIFGIALERDANLLATLLTKPPSARRKRAPSHP
jgi:hypothetical protein